MFRVLGIVPTFDIAHAVSRGESFAKWRRCGKHVRRDRQATCFRSVMAVYGLPALTLILFPSDP